MLTYPLPGKPDEEGTAFGALLKGRGGKNMPTLNVEILEETLISLKQDAE
jgi:hypothetical protein